MHRRKCHFAWSLVSAVTAYIAGPALLALFTVAILIPVPPRQARADHDSTNVVCPDPIREGNSGQMRVRMPGSKDISVAVFTYHDSYSASSNDFTEYHGGRFESEPDEDTVRIPVVTTEDTSPEHDETFSTGFWVDGEWHGCEVVIDDDDAPEITFVEISSAHADWYAYRAREHIDVTVNTDARVEVGGTPLLSLYIGDDGYGDNWRGAEYHSGSGTRALVFRYKVRPGDFDMDGITVSAAASGDDGSPVYGFSGHVYADGTDVPIEYAHSGLEGGERHMVDGRPYVKRVRVSSSPSEGWHAYRVNQVIEFSLTFDQDVEVDGEVTAGLSVGLDDNNWHVAERQATHLRGSGTEILEFVYTVRPGDMDPKGIRVATGSFFGNALSSFGGTGLVKAKGTGVEAHSKFFGTGRLSKHKVDTAPPSVSSVNITSEPADGEAYDAGEVVSVEVVFSEEVTTRGGPELELDVGGVARQMVLRSSPVGSFAKSLVFGYTVQEGDEDGDGIGISANTLRLNGGGIYDVAGNSANLSFDVVPADSGHKVGPPPAPDPLW